MLKTLAARLPAIPISALANLALLYSGKLSSVLVALIFLPLYTKLLGPDQFGLVAVILSLQALLMMLDLGMSALVSRDLAAGTGFSHVSLGLVHSAVAVLTIFYLLLGGVVTVVVWIWSHYGNVSVTDCIAAIALFWTLTLQNIFYAAMLARRNYRLSSLSQLAGVSVRAMVAYIVMAHVSATVSAFLLAQAAVSALHCLLSWVLFTRTCAQREGVIWAAMPTFGDIVALLRRGQSLALFSLAGAAVMQLDKPIVSALMSPTVVAPYFLASTLCIIPVSLLAGPVSQFFQPQLIKSLSAGNVGQATKVARQFSTVLILTTLLPSAWLWMVRDTLIELWMGPGQLNILISQYVAILLPGVAIGALGFIPYTLLVAAGDFRAQARLSTCLSALTLALAAACAYADDILGICFIYAGYHASSTIVSWVRAQTLPQTRLCATAAFLRVSPAILLLASMMWILRYASMSSQSL